MSAEIINLADFRAMRTQTVKPADEPSAELSVVDHTYRFHFWAGASGKRYVHTVYNLIDCPALAGGNYVLVKRDEDGRRTALSIGRCMHEAVSLNLADLRQRAASLGANEVHVHLLAETAKQMKLVEFDLKTAQMQQAAPSAPRWHH